ncbi:MAG: prepilin-type N-terminal cleavage/methylation domain-containing protein [Candidatus Saccharibacteria bacterium]
MKSKAFTIIELVVVITVIGILATITVVGYGNWRQSVDESVVKSDLQAAAAAMENYRSFNGGYPADDNTRLNLIKLSPGVSLSSYQGGSSYYWICASKYPKMYCVTNTQTTPYST